MNLRRFGVWTNLAISAALMLLLWALFVWVASRPALRTLVDLTPQRINTVSLATKELLRELRDEEAEVEFHLFQGEISGQPRDQYHAQVLAIRQRLVQQTALLLRRYAALGGESVKVIAHDPYRELAKYREAAQAFNYTDQDAEALVVTVKLKGKERRHRKLSLVSDLAVIDVGAAQQGPAKSNTLPVLKDYQGENAISSALKGLLVQGIPVLYMVKGYSPSILYGESPLDYSRLVQELTKSGFEVRSLELGKSQGVPADASLVICIEPTRDFLPRDADALYAYLNRGGRLFINYGWSAIQDLNPTGGKLGELLGYQVSVPPVFHRIPDQMQRGGGSLDGTEAVARLSLYKNKFHPTTRRMYEQGRALEVYMGREVRERSDKPKNVRLEELLWTGPEGWLAVPDRQGQPDFRSPAIKLRSHVVSMSCEVDGVLAEPSTGSEQRKDDNAASTGTGRAVIVAGLFCNNKAFPYFGDFALNICNWMTERKVLLDIETTRYTMRTLDIGPQQYARVWWLLVVYVPGAFLVLGLIVWWRRRH